VYINIIAQNKVNNHFICWGLEFEYSGFGPKYRSWSPLVKYILMTIKEENINTIYLKIIIIIIIKLNKFK